MSFFTDLRYHKRRINFFCEISQEEMIMTRIVFSETGRFDNHVFLDLRSYFYSIT